MFDSVDLQPVYVEFMKPVYVGAELAFINGATVARRLGGRPPYPFVEEILPYHDGFVITTREGEKTYVPGHMVRYIQLFGGKPIEELVDGTAPVDNSGSFSEPQPKRRGRPPKVRETDV